MDTKNKYLAGQAIPGKEERAKTLNYYIIGKVLGLPIYAGTFNVSLIEPIELWKPDVRVNEYSLWRCRVRTEQQVKEEILGLPGWIIRVAEEDLPDTFLEVISGVNIRSALKAEKWPAFSVEVELY